MTLELVSSRIIAPLVGSSIYTWTMVIGVTLLGLSIGSIYGGRLADNENIERKMFIILLLSSVSVAFIPMGLQILKQNLSFALPLWIIMIVTSVSLFLIPTIFIGMIQPLVVKQYTIDMKHLGRQYGLLSGVWSAGSILGVFLTGFVLVSLLGTKMLVFTLAGCLLALAIGWLTIYRNIQYGKQLLAAALFVIILFISMNSAYSSEASNILYSGDTNYYHAKVVDFSIQNVPLRGLFLDTDAQGVASPVIHPKFYIDSYLLFKDMKPEPKKILFLGGGSYTLPKSFADQHPKAQIDVLEIDPQVTALAEQYFNLTNYPVVSTFFRDPRIFLKQSPPENYDIIFGDVYNSLISIPWHLITKEAHQEVYDALSDKGIYALAFISSLEDSGKEFTESIVRTFAEVFPIYKVMFLKDNPSEVGNMIIFGQKGVEVGDFYFGGTDSVLSKIIKEYPQLEDWRYYFNHKIDIDSDGMIFTDDHAPVEQIMKKIIDSHYTSYIETYNFLSN